MGEALILTDRGLAVYRTPYGELIGAQGLEGLHSGLFPERTAPYPPLAILVHWPWAWLERAGALSPGVAHRGVVWLWTLVALAACAVVVCLLKGLPLPAQAWAVALAVPLLVGIGINGFIDAGYLLCGALACLSWKQERRVLAVWCLALAAALHFRAVVFAPLGAVVLWQLRGSRRHLVAAALVVPTLIAAAALAGTLDTIPAHNPVHFSHLKAPLLLFTLISGALATFLWKKDERLCAATVAAAFALAVLERSHGWWHAGALLAPGLVLAARTRRSNTQWTLVLAWTLGSSYLAYRHGASVFWTWVPFALGGL